MFGAFAIVLVAAALPSLAVGTDDGSAQFMVASVSPFTMRKGRSYTVIYSTVMVPSVLESTVSANDAASILLDALETVTVPYSNFAGVVPTPTFIRPPTALQTTSNLPAATSGLSSNIVNPTTTLPFVPAISATSAATGGSALPPVPPVIVSQPESPQPPSSVVAPSSTADIAGALGALIVAISAAQTAPVSPSAQLSTIAEPSTLATSTGLPSVIGLPSSGSTTSVLTSSEPTASGLSTSQKPTEVTGTATAASGSITAATTTAAPPAAGSSALRVNLLAIFGLPMLIAAGFGLML